MKRADAFRRIPNEETPLADLNIESDCFKCVLHSKQSLSIFSSYRLLSVFGGRKTDLLHKGAIREAGFVKRSKTYGRTFAPAMTREGYFATTIFSHKKKPDFVGLMAELLKRDDLTAEQLAQVLELAQKAQK